jgi:hypothetical protein
VAVRRQRVNLCFALVGEMTGHCKQGLILGTG